VELVGGFIIWTCLMSLFLHLLPSSCCWWFFFKFSQSTLFRSEKPVIVSVTTHFVLNAPPKHWVLSTSEYLFFISLFNKFFVQADDTKLLTPFWGDPTSGRFTILITFWITKIFHVSFIVFSILMFPLVSHFFIASFLWLSGVKLDGMTCPVPHPGLEFDRHFFLPLFCSGTFCVTAKEETFNSLCSHFFLTQTF